MQSFLEDVVADIWETTERTDNLIIVVPSKRAGLFLLQIFARTTKKNIFAPSIVTIEEFVEQLSGLKSASRTQLLFELYTTYTATAGNKAESFYSFSKWANTLLQDFNEVDRYLIETDKIFSYLTAIQETNHWYLQPEKTPLIEDYLRFWNTLEELYDNFKTHLLDLGYGYQGMIYRKACERLDSYIESTRDKKHLFIGFNALNASESFIIQELLLQKKADIYWDLDPYFLEDTVHDAGYFIRSYKRTWPYFSGHPLKGLKESYLSKKNIQIIGIPKNVSQAKYVGNLLKEIQRERATPLSQTAIVLGNESLLNPILNAIPPEISKINITMGFPLHKTPMAGMFNEFIELYLHWEPRGWFYKDVLSLLSHPYMQSLLNTEADQTTRISETIRAKNLVYLTPSLLRSMITSDLQIIDMLFSETFVAPKTFVDTCLELIFSLKTVLETKEDTLAMEYLVRFNVLFHQLKEYLTKYDFIKDLKSLQSLYKELISNETLDFYGEPLEGVQIMGMLESRNLDFETVILTSVNEGILPSGKSNNSFIPFDLKNEFHMPTYKEKDAVYTYHFYRLLQRAKNVYILYNTQPDVLEGGEKSRFISQLLTDENKKQDILHLVASPDIKVQVAQLETIGKDPDVLLKLKERAQKGFSPTLLSNYIRNPIDFYKRVVLGIEDPSDVEETIAANTFGTVIHNTLEELYQPFIGSLLSPDKLRSLNPLIPKLVKEHFTKSYPNVDVRSGKNLIAFKVIERYIGNYIKLEINDAAKHEIRVLALEEKMKMEFTVPGIPFPIFLKGTLDRVDVVDGKVRILDYKTGNAKRSEVEIVEWESIINEPDKSKAFQLLCYALMYSEKHNLDQFEAAIVPFKNLQEGLLTFATKANTGRSKKDTEISPQTLDFFKEQLYNLLETICSLDVPFVAKET